MRFSSQEIGRSTQFKDSEFGKLSDFTFSTNDFLIKEAKVKTGIWPFTNEYSIPPQAINFLKSDPNHLFIDMTSAQLQDSADLRPSSTQEPPLTEAYPDYYSSSIDTWDNGYRWTEEDGFVSSYFLHESLTGASASPYGASEDDFVLSCFDLSRSEIFTLETDIARVADVVFDPVAMKAIYLVCEGFSSGEKLVLLPLEWVDRFDPENFQLDVNDISLRDFDSAPDFNREDVINESLDRELIAHYGKSLSWIDSKSRFDGVRNSPRALI